MPTGAVFALALSCDRWARFHAAPQTAEGANPPIYVPINTTAPASKQSIKRECAVSDSIGMRRKITNETWKQIGTAYADGVNLCEIARKMNIPQVGRPD